MQQQTYLQGYKSPMDSFSYFRRLANVSQYSKRWYKSPLPGPLLQSILRHSSGVSRKEFCDRLAMSATATGMRTFVSKIISHLRVEKLSNNTGARRQHLCCRCSLIVFIHMHTGHMTGPMSTLIYSKAYTLCAHTDYFNNENTKSSSKPVP